MQNHLDFKFKDIEFRFFGVKFMMDLQRRSIILSDLHLGKTNHFRKNGIQVPRNLADVNISKLDNILKEVNPKEILILGDLFHSEMNAEWQNFKALRFHNSKVKFVLVKGNHDSFQMEEYHKANIEVLDLLMRDGIVYSHEPIASQEVNIYGHIHPAVILRGTALQSMRVPCFHISKNELILPAFGTFTGTHAVKPNSKDVIFGIADDKIFRAQNKRQKSNS